MPAEKLASLQEKLAQRSFEHKQAIVESGNQLE